MTVSSSNSLPVLQHDGSSTTCDSNPAVSSSKENTEKVHIYVVSYMGNIWRDKILVNTHFLNFWMVKYW